jgi:hypothetical protein
MSGFGLGLHATYEFNFNIITETAVTIPYIEAEAKILR